MTQAIRLYIVMYRSHPLEKWIPHAEGRGGLEIVAHHFIRDARREMQRARDKYGKRNAYVACFMPTL